MISRASAGERLGKCWESPVGEMSAVVLAGHRRLGVCLGYPARALGEVWGSLGKCLGYPVKSVSYPKKNLGLPPPDARGTLGYPARDFCKMLAGMLLYIQGGLDDILKFSGHVRSLTYDVIIKPLHGPKWSKWSITPEPGVLQSRNRHQMTRNDKPIRMICHMTCLHDCACMIACLHAT